MTRVALCGAGMIAHAHAAAARLNGFPLTAVASRHRERARRVAGDWSAAAVGYADLPAGADLVVVATPPQRHADDAIRLLDAGCLVLLEKPLCTTLADADRVVDAAARHGQRLLYAENLAYSPCITTLLGQVGGLGPLGHLEARTLQPLPHWGGFTTQEWGGGALFDLGVHPLAIVLLAGRAGGLGGPVAVRCTLRGGAGHLTDEHAELTIRFASGLTGRVVSSWQHVGEPIWDVQVAGERGVLRAELQPLPSLERDGTPVHLAQGRGDVPQIEAFGYRQQMAALVDDASAGRTPSMSAAFGRQVLDVVCAAYRSAGGGGTDVPLPFEGRRDLTPLQLWRAE